MDWSIAKTVGATKAIVDHVEGMGMDEGSTVGGKEVVDRMRTVVRDSEGDS